jgi:hypothetical protein
MVPPGSLDPVPSNVHDSSAHEPDATATGGPSAGGVIVTGP